LGAHLGFLLETVFGPSVCDVVLAIDPDITLLIFISII